MMRNMASPAPKHTVAIIVKSGAIQLQCAKSLTRARDATICLKMRYTKNTDTPPISEPIMRKTAVTYSGPQKERTPTARSRQAPWKIVAGGRILAATLISSQSEGSSPRGEKIKYTSVKPMPARKARNTSRFPNLSPSKNFLSIVINFNVYRYYPIFRHSRQ